MGMFDELWCKYPLPDGYKGERFQTKDLECGLDRYRITADGVFELFMFDEEPDGPRKLHWIFPDYMYQPTKRVRERWVAQDYTGAICFYGYEGDLNDDTPIAERWHEYTALFERGRLDRLIASPSRAATAREAPQVAGDRSRDEKPLPPRTEDKR